MSIHGSSGPFGSLSSGFSRWGNRLQVATARHARRAAKHAVDLAVSASLENLPKGPIQETLENVHDTYKRFRDDRYSEEPSKKLKTGMPVRSGARGRNALRRPRRTVRRRRYNRRTPVPMMWPRQKLVKFRQVVCSSFVAPAGGGTPGTAIFKANSLNDAFGTAGNQLPLGLDQWAAMYSRYTVVGSRLNVRIHASALTGGILVGVSQIDNSAALGSHEYYMEIPRTRSKLLTGDLDHTAIGINFSAKKKFKVNKFGTAENLQGTFSATPGDPTEVTYYHLWAQDINTADGATVEYVATLEFIVLLDESIVPSRSGL